MIPASGKRYSDKSRRGLQRIVLLATLIAVVPVLAGCADFDPEKLDVFGFGDKKKLPGDRRPVFPEGVPGVTQGIPPEYLKENLPPPEAALAAPVAPVNVAPAEPQQQAAAAPVAEPEPKPKPKPKKKVVKRAPKPKATPAANTRQPAPAQQQPQQAQAPASAPWPTQPAQSTGNAPASSAPWPSAPAPGTFSR